MDDDRLYRSAGFIADIGYSEGFSLITEGEREFYQIRLGVVTDGLCTKKRR